jgi:hypothetical protein
MLSVFKDKKRMSCKDGKYAPQSVKDACIDEMIDALLHDFNDYNYEAINPYDLASPINETPFIDGVKTLEPAGNKLDRAVKKLKPADKKLKPAGKPLRSAERKPMLVELLREVDGVMRPGSSFNSKSNYMTLRCEGQSRRIAILEFTNLMKKYLLGIRLFDFQAGKKVLALFAVDITVLFG